MSIDRGWYYLIEPEGGRFAPLDRRLATPAGEVLTVRRHGSPGRVEVVEPTRTWPVATLLRAARAVGDVVAGPVRVILTTGEGDDGGRGDSGGETAPADPATTGRRPTLLFPAEAVAGDPSPWPFEARVIERLRDVVLPAVSPVETPPVEIQAPASPVARVLFFESLMNAELPHNDGDLSQGVLHMLSALDGLPGIDVVLANVKMAITGTDRPVLGLDALAAAVAGAPVDLVCITLLEGYWEGVISLVRELRALGCRGHIALGGVMPTLTPEHVAAHFPDCTFVCRGAGEYFLPRLLTTLGDRNLGESNVDTPLTDAQVDALLRMDGLIVVDRAGGRLLSCNAAKVVEVEDLDAVPLALRHLERRHLATGVELSTSRGCLHRCTFCSIIGRESYQARSADGVIALLGRYHAYYATLFGEGPPDSRGRNTSAPRNAYRVHISDDDFACDRDRVLAFFRALRQTPFRLSSCQVSIGDLCRREKGKLLAEADPELLSVITPDCFDDHGTAIPARDFVADHQSRRWSSYLQIGVESFSDRELARLGKGYQRAHVRAIVAALSARGVHHDAYFILSNADTSPRDLLDVLDEVVRLKLRFPLFFHLRFPVVPRLVSYFPSASHRRQVRQGERPGVLRGFATVPGYPELDYPFVDYDAPRDPLVREAVETSFFTDVSFYAGSFERLRETMLARWRSTGDANAAWLARSLDDRFRRRLFDVLLADRDAHRDAHRGPEKSTVNAHLLPTAEAHLGPSATWLAALQRHAQGGTPRLVVVPTWQCELRCGYCYIPKQDGRVMSRETLEQSVGLLFSSERPALTLQFFGGEALLEWELVQHAISWGTEEAARRGKSLDFVVSSNGWSLDEPRLGWLSKWPVKLELSLDGDPETQRRSRPARQAGEDSYAHGIPRLVDAIADSGLPYDVIMVVHPQFVDRLARNYLHIVDLGFSRLQINPALGKVWTVAQQQSLATQLFALASELDRRPGVTLVNAEQPPMPIRLNGEVTVDWDGTIYGGNAFLHETEHKARFRVGHLADGCSFDRYWLDAPANRALLDWSYPPDVTANNLKVGAILSDFLRWYRGRRGEGTLAGVRGEGG